MKWLIFCVGETSKRFAEGRITEYYDTVVAFLDNSPTKQGRKVNGVKVVSPSEISKLQFDKIAVPEQHYPEVVRQLAGLGIDETRTVRIDGWNPQIRKDWLADFAGLMQDQRACVAEAGVFRGDFALCINTAFPEDSLYLFDTFEGLPEIDVKRESGGSIAETYKYNATSVEYVLSRLPYPEKTVVCKGYFPDTAGNLPDRFKFVNLDLDLYAPTLAGLRLFYPKMTVGGVILVHDYFPDAYPGVKQAVEDFERENGKLLKLPIGDKISIAIQKGANDERAE